MTLDMELYIPACATEQPSLGFARAPMPVIWEEHLPAELTS